MSANRVLIIVLPALLISVLVVRAPLRMDDFYVSYELNTYTDSPSGMGQVYSDLHANIQD